MPQPRPLTARLADLPKFWTYKDLLGVVFQEDEDRFITAWCDGSLPAPFRAVCLETLGLPQLTAMLLRFTIRLQLEARPPKEPAV